MKEENKISNKSIKKEKTGYEEKNKRNHSNHFSLESKTTGVLCEGAVKKVTT